MFDNTLWIGADLPSETPVNFRAGFIADDLAQRINREMRTIGATAKADLSRYYSLLNLGRSSLVGQISTNELNLIAAGVIEEWKPKQLDSGYTGYDAARIQRAFLIANLQQTMSRAHLDIIHGVDTQSLIERIQRMNDLEIAALVDTAERLWSVRSKGTADDYAELGLFTSDYSPPRFPEWASVVDREVVRLDSNLSFALNGKNSTTTTLDFLVDNATWLNPVGLVSVAEVGDSLRLMGLPTMSEPVPNASSSKKQRDLYSARRAHRFECWLTGKTAKNARKSASIIVEYLNGRKASPFS